MTEIPNQRVEKIKATRQYNELFAAEWAKCIVSPAMLPDELGYMTRMHIRKCSLVQLNLKFAAYKTLLHVQPQEWSLNFIQIGLDYAFHICENEYYEKRTPGMKDFIVVLEKLTMLKEIISQMFLECEKKCINMCLISVK